MIELKALRDWAGISLKKHAVDPRARPDRSAGNRITIPVESPRPEPTRPATRADLDKQLATPTRRSGVLIPCFTINPIGRPTERMRGAADKARDAQRRLRVALDAHAERLDASETTFAPAAGRIRSEETASCAAIRCFAS